MGHSGGTDGVKGLTKATEGFELLNGDLSFCEPCALGKIKREMFPSRSETRATAPLGRIHSDICGPVDLGYKGLKYFISFIDDKSRYSYIYTMKVRSEAAEKFKEYKSLVENQFNTSIKVLRTDNAPEYCQGEFKRLIDEAGIHHELTLNSPFLTHHNKMASPNDITELS